MPMLDLHGPLAFTPPGGPALPAAALGARIDPARAALRLRLSPETWARVVADELFGAHPAVLPVECAELDPARPVTVVLDLHPALAATLHAGPDPAARLERGLRTPSEPLLHTEHWRLRTAAQAVSLPEGTPAAAAEVESGFTSAYGRDAAAGPPTLALDAAVDTALKAQGLTPVPFSGSAVRARVEDPVGTWTLVVMMEPAAELCTVYSAFPRKVPAPQQAQATEILMQINAQLAIGALELDEDGQLRVRTGVDLGGPPRGTAVLEGTIGHNLALMREAWETFAALAPA